MSENIAESVVPSNVEASTQVEEKPEEVPLEDVTQSDEDSEDQKCADESCKCQDQKEDESSGSEEDEVKEYDVIRIHHQYQYFPPGMSELGFLVLFLHLINALLQLSERGSNQLSCFRRPY